MSRTVLLTDGAARDLDEVYATAYDQGGADEANRMLDRIEVAFEWLQDRAERGEPLVALRELGMRDARQLRLEGVRMVYRVLDEDVQVVSLVQRDRSIQALLQRRMLDA